MTSSWLSFARNSILLAALALSAGCGDDAKEANLENAQEAFDKGDFGKAAQIYEKTLASAPDNVDACLMLTLSRIKQADYIKAVESAEKAAEVAGGDSDVIETLAQAYYYNRQYDKARENYLKIATNDKLEPAVRSQAYSGLGVIDVSLFDPTDPETIWLIHRARTEFFRALILNNRNASAHFNLGYIYSHIGDFRDIATAKIHYEFFEKCEKDTKRAQDVQRTEIPALRAAVNQDTVERLGSNSCDNVTCAKELEKAKAEEKKGQFLKARRFYESALKANPLSYDAAIALARSWERDKKRNPNSREALENVAKYYREASLNKRSADNYIAAGNAARDAKKWADSVEAYSRAVAINYAKKDMTAIDSLITMLKKTNNNPKSGAWKSAQVYQDYRNDIPSLKKAVSKQ